MNSFQFKKNFLLDLTSLSFPDNMICIFLLIFPKTRKISKLFNQNTNAPKNVNNIRFQIYWILLNGTQINTKY